MEEVTSAPARARPGRLQLGVVVSGAAFAALSVVVAAGGLGRLDQHAVVHWMPDFDPSTADDTVPELIGLVAPFGLDGTWWHMLLELVMYPASVLISFTLFAVGSLVLWRRGARVAAVVWGASWFVANAIEVAMKIAIEKPALYRSKDGVSYHLAAFDHAYPSGHALRAVMVAGLVAFVWNRFGRVAACWVVAVAVCLIGTAWHVPSEVLGGLLFGVFVVLATHATTDLVEARRA